MGLSLQVTGPQCFFRLSGRQEKNGEWGAGLQGREFEHYSNAISDFEGGTELEEGRDVRLHLSMQPGRCKGDICGEPQRVQKAWITAWRQKNVRVKR